MYVIGDVHGCYKTLMALLDKLDTEKGVCFVGDLIDRGPRSRQVVDFVMHSLFDCVKGNHEDMADTALETGQYGLWFSNGGDATINSYRIAKNKLTVNEGTALLRHHIDWMYNLPLIMEYEFEYNLSSISKYNLGFCSKLLVSHSSAAQYIISGKNEDLEESVLWDRDMEPAKIKNTFNVFGHSIQSNGLPLIKDHFACIDTGCFIRHHEKMGVLTALEYPSLNVIQQRNID